MEMVKRQGDRISELEAQLRSDKPTDAKPTEGKFACHFQFVMLTLAIHFLCYRDSMMILIFVSTNTSMH